ncbi:MAG: glycosyl transferase [Candidatus Aminicenantes bacterium]|nr:MAG: glycosyl transferase [Candidatus Aminicenantes bacterium]
MSDFFQNGVITTFHKLGKPNLRKIEEELKVFSKERPIGLVLPSLYREYASGALPNIMNELKKVNYINEIVLCLDAADAKQFEEVKKHFSAYKRFNIVWNDGPRMKKMYKLLEENELSPGERGKGRAVWIAFGYVLAKGKSQVIALHDCDIITYDRFLLARLCYPVANPNSEYEFCKGYYSRITDRMYGRATRLFFTPFMRALMKILGFLPFLVYLDSFRYALAGEIAMRRDLTMAMRIPFDWGLEVGTLAEVYRNMALNRICQVDISDAYEHKHQVLIPDDPEKGILKMSVDIAKSIFRTLAQEGVQFSEGFFKTLSNIYLKIAQETVVRYENDAAINCLEFDRHDELGCIEAFAEGIKLAGGAFWNNPSKTNLLHSWSRVTAAVPEFFSLIKEAVKKDNE